MADEVRLCHRCGYLPLDPAESRCPRDGLYLIQVAEHERSPRDPFLGSVLGDKYPILGILGSGGMGTVYLSHHPRLGFDVAVKVIRPDVLVRDEKAAARFRREARAMARLSSHPGVATLLDFGTETDGTLYMVMERVVGENLHQAYRRGGLTTRQLVGMGLAVLDVLAVAHERGVLHRDLKPGNVVILSDTHRYGRQLKIKVLDFGLAKLMGDAHLSLLSQQGIAQGTPTYMSPEQFSGERVDHRSDLYSLATILYEGLVGRPPFMLVHPEGASDILRLGQLKSRCEPEPMQPHPHLPPGLRRVILRGLSRRPEDRYGSAEEMAADLDRVVLDGHADSPLPPSIAALRHEDLISGDDSALELVHDLELPSDIDLGHVPEDRPEILEEPSCSSPFLQDLERWGIPLLKPRGRRLTPVSQSTGPPEGPEQPAAGTGHAEGPPPSAGAPGPPARLPRQGSSWRCALPLLERSRRRAPPSSRAPGKPRPRGRHLWHGRSWAPLLIISVVAFALWLWKDPGLAPPRPAPVRDAASSLPGRAWQPASAGAKGPAVPAACRGGWRGWRSPPPGAQHEALRQVGAEEQPCRPLPARPRMLRPLEPRRTLPGQPGPSPGSTGAAVSGMGHEGGAGSLPDAGEGAGSASGKGADAGVGSSCPGPGGACSDELVRP